MNSGHFYKLQKIECADTSILNFSFRIEFYWKWQEPKNSRKVVNWPNTFNKIGFFWKSLLFYKFQIKIRMLHRRYHVFPKYHNFFSNKTQQSMVTSWLLKNPSRTVYAAIFALQSMHRIISNYFFQMIEKWGGWGYNMLFLTCILKTVIGRYVYLSIKIIELTPHPLRIRSC